MEAYYLQRLRILIDQVNSLSSSADQELKQFTAGNLVAVNLRVTSTKLKTAIDSFVSETYKYFQLVNNPATDELSEYTTIQVKAEEILSELNARLQDASANLNKNNFSYPSASKLPKIELRKFNGDILSWHQFWDIFSSNVDSRELNDVDKLLYLQSVLEGDARKVIEGLDTTNANYPIAIATLKEHYGKPNNVIDAHYVAFFDIKPVNNAIIEIRRIYNEIERHLRILASMGEDTNHNILRVIIKQKFPEDLLYELRMKLGTEPDNTANVRKYLGEIISAREESSRVKTSIDVPKENNENFTIETLHARAEDNTHVKKHTISRRLFKKHEQNTRRGGNFRMRGNRARISTSSHLGSERGYYSENVHSKKPNDRQFTPSTTKRPRDMRDHSQDSSRPPTKKPKLCCIFCENQHYSDKCHVITALQDRKKKLEGRCFNCLRKGHNISECKSQSKCWHCGEIGKHNRVICPSNINVKTKTMHINTQKCNTLLQTATVYTKAIGSNTSGIKCRLLLDSGSQRSYITSRLAKMLKLPTLEQNHLSVFTFGSSNPHELESPLVKLQIQSRINCTKEIYANVVPHITNNLPGIQGLWSTINTDKQRILADDGTSSDEIDLLIGNDYYYSFMTNEKIQIAEDLYLVNSTLGWIVSGRHTSAKENGDLSVVTYFQTCLDHNSFSDPDPPIRHDSLKVLWDLESIGINDSPKASRDDEAVEHFNKTTIFANNRYQVKWPWIEYPPQLPSNFGLACGRLNSLRRRTNEKTLSAYDKVFKEQLRDGVIEIINKPEEVVDHPVHYLPHHGIMQNDKLRIVYDASAKVKSNKSLNECLYRGPPMLEELAGLLIRFREHKIGIVADVEKAFLQIGLHLEDRDVTRFLWFKDAKENPSPSNLLHMRFCRVPFGIISSPFLLNATLKHHLRKSRFPILTQIAEDLYVDNVVTGAGSVSEAITMYKTTRKSFEDLSMNLRQWNTNSTEFKNTIPTRFGDPEAQKIKVLGLDWNLRTDELQLRFNGVKKDLVITKREILRTTASIFDPCGFVAPFVLPAKLFLQELWSRKFEWDTKLPIELVEIWTEIAKILENIQHVRVPRYYKDDIRTRNNEEISHELHCFTDASTQAYAAVVYMRTVYAENIMLRFIIGKSRLTDKNKKTQIEIPKLELIGVLLGTRLLQFVTKFLREKITSTYLWSDSKIAISWCESEKLLPPFIARRVDEIKRNKPLHIRYIPSHMNAADVATRKNCSKSDYDKWLLGPKFLTQSSCYWPKNETISTETLTSQVVSGGQDLTEAITNTNSPTTRQPQNPPELDTPDNTAEIEIVHLQQKYFPNEIAGKETDLSRSLQLFKDKQGLLRCGGRLVNTGWSENQRHPILLPKNDPFTINIIEKAHNSNYHVGVSHTLSLVRMKYWIPQGRTQVKKVINKCQACKKYGGGPYKLPEMAPLPAERTNYNPPFTFTGIDYFVPLIVSSTEKPEKRWVCLFTCLSVRAIHLEVVGDMSSEECLLALRRFISVRGIPKMFVSDNALQFKLTADVFTNGYCIQNNIKWKFIPELAPWFGGFYERLIGIVKNCLKRTLDKHLLNTTQLITVMKEIEAVVNTRPLTTVGSDLEHVLSPADFLRSCGALVPIVNEEEFLLPATTKKHDLIEGWKRGQMILQEYVKMFVNQYLTSLRERRSTHRQPRIVVNTVPKIGDIVQIKADSNRALWKVGKIVNVIKGSDGHVRVAKVCTSPNETLTRSIAHLYPLEIEDEIVHETEDEIVHETEDEIVHETEGEIECEINIERPKAVAEAVPPIRKGRLSAQRAKEKIREWTSQLLIYLPIH